MLNPLKFLLLKREWEEYYLPIQMIWCRVELVLPMSFRFRPPHAGSSSNIPCFMRGRHARLRCKKRLISRWVERKTSVLWFLSRELLQREAPRILGCELSSKLQQPCPKSFNFPLVNFLNNLIVIWEEQPLNPDKYNQLTPVKVTKQRINLRVHQAS